MISRRAPGKPVSAKAGAHVVDRYLRGGVLLAAFILACNRPEAARLGLDPLMGDGAAGRTVNLTGSGFTGGANYAVTIGGYAPVPATALANASGQIVQPLVLPFLPAGAHDVVLTGGGKTLTFIQAYRVYRNICLSPAQGDGRAGGLWSGTLTGAWTGMVFRVEGTGFAAGGSVGANTIQVAGTATTHPAITVSPDGRLPSTTVLVRSNLPLGLKDLTINDGTGDAVFAKVYEVRRTIGINPARGVRSAGMFITVTGWGFADGIGAIQARSIVVAGATTTHPAVNVVNGWFTVTVQTDSKPAANGSVDVTGHESFPRTFHGVSGTKPPTAMVSPQVLSGVPNETFLVAGLTDFAPGVIGPDAIQIRDAALNLVAGTRHGQVTVAANGAFPAVWVSVTGPVSAAADRISIPNPGGVMVDCRVLFTKSTTGMCPVYSNGAAGFTVTITGYAMNPNTAIGAGAITVGGFAATYPATATGAGGNFGPTVLSLPALQNGDQQVIVTAGSAWSFLGLLHVRRSIGLSFICGPGSVGDAVSITGSGFTGGSSVNPVQFGAASVNPAPIAVGASGSFGPSPLILPALDAGPYDVTAQEVFTQAYRVYNPRVEVSKYRDPAFASAGQAVTYSFSFTNTGIVGDPRAASLVVSDNIPSGLEYETGSSACEPTATPEYFHAGSGWSPSEAPVTDVTGIKWTLSSPLPSGASGYASFRVRVQ